MPVADKAFFAMQYIKKIFLGLFLGANVLTVLLLWASCACTWISPSVVPQQTVITLAFPIFLTANLAFVFFWLICKARFAVLPVLGTLVVGGYVMDYCPLHCQEDTPNDSSILLVSHNIGTMTGEEKHLAFVQYVKETDADILCLQEVDPTLLTRKAFVAMLDSMGYGKMQKDNRCILSKFPFAGGAESLAYTSTTGNGSMVCRLLCGPDTLLIVNNHLESYGLTDEEKGRYKKAIKHPESDETSGTVLTLARRISNTAQIRGAQADSLCAFIDSHAGESMIVCGDFNDTPISYVYQQIGKRLDCAWRNSGQGIGLSYNQMGFFVRIDHIFHSSDWTSHNTRIDNKMVLSDHYPLHTILCRKPN